MALVVAHLEPEIVIYIAMNMLREFRQSIIRFKPVNIDIIDLKLIVEELPKIRHLFIPIVFVAYHVDF